MPIQTPICDFGKKALLFELKSTENKVVSLNDIKGENGTLIMFICNHCPYVKAIIEDLVNDCNELKKLGINSAAICSNDVINYPEDSFDKMIEFAKENNFSFPTKQTDSVLEFMIADKPGSFSALRPDFFVIPKAVNLEFFKSKPF